jgi:hypothetical protein
VDSAEQKILIARLQANWPQRGYADPHGNLTSHGNRMAEVLERFLFCDAEPAVQRLMDTGLFPPSPGELRAEIEEQRSIRLTSEAGALPARGTWTEADEKASMEAHAKAFAGWREKHPRRGDADG